MSARTSGGRLAKITRELAANWGETRYYWSDAKSREFHKEYMEKLPDEVKGAVTVIDELDKLLTKIRRDCE